MAIFKSLSSISVFDKDSLKSNDITGLQTFPKIYERGIPLSTLSQWG
ncbi:MAG: hypothetical protein KDC52_13160 [Ignavibacteriae bacterium]|nr:hypothetical protein [Ignavibacteriota bacterium]